MAEAEPGQQKTPVPQPPVPGWEALSNNSRSTAGGKAGMWEQSLSEVQIQREAEGGSDFEKKSPVNQLSPGHKINTT